MMSQVFRYAFREPNRITASMVCAVFLLSGAYCTYTGSLLRYPDEQEYHSLATNLLAGAGYVNNEQQPTAFRPPGYPVFLSAIYKFWQDPMAAKIANATAYAALAWLLSICAGRVMASARFFPSVFLVLYPVGIYTASTLYPQTMGSLLLLSCVALLTFNLRLRSAFLAGILYGLLVLFIPAFLALAPLFLLIVLVQRKSLTHRTVYHGMLFCVSSALVVFPWTIRNWLTFSSFIPVSSNSGVMLLLGNNEHAQPNDGANADISTYRARVAGHDEIYMDKQYRQFAYDWVRRFPKEALSLYASKVGNYFNYRNNLVIQSETSKWRDLVMAVTYYPLLFLSLARLRFVQALPLAMSEKFIYALYFGNAFVSAVFFTRIRYRIPFDMLLIIPASITVALLLSGYFSRLHTLNK